MTETMTETETETETMTETDEETYKGFSSNMECMRSTRFEVGKTLHYGGKVQVFEGGFHSCRQPLAVFETYPPVRGARYGKVRIGGRTHSDMHKTASERIKLLEELSLKDMLLSAEESAAGAGLLSQSMDALSAVHNEREFGAAHALLDMSVAASAGRYSLARVSDVFSVASATGDENGALADAPYSSACVGGDNSAALATRAAGVACANGCYSLARASGDSSAALARGSCSEAEAQCEGSVAASCGNQAESSARGSQSVAASVGKYAKSVADGEGSIAASSGSDARAECNIHNAVAVARGDGAVAAVNRFNSVALVDGSCGMAVATDTKCLAIACGKNATASGELGSFLVLTEMDAYGQLKDVRAVLVDGETVKANVPYRLENGEVVKSPR